MNYVEYWFGYKLQKEEDKDKGKIDEFEALYEKFKDRMISFYTSTFLFRL